MTSRDNILRRIRTLVADAPPLAPPPVPEVWPRQSPDRATMIRRFGEELVALQGEVIRCGSIDEAGRKLIELMDASPWATIAACDGPAARALLDRPDASRVTWCQSDWEARDLADVPVGLVVADYLLADTGSVMIACGTVQDRLLCYLPPACVVLARSEQLAEHLPAVWPEVALRAADPALRGEFVFITGPSRTSDIEKILILGVHGPKRLIVLLID